MADPASNLSKTQLTSTLQGFGYLTPVDTSITVAAFNLGAGAHSSAYAAPLTNSQSDTPALVRAMWSGISNTDRNNKWSMVYGETYFKSEGGWMEVGAVVKLTALGITFMVQYYNSAGITHTVPAHTITIRAYPYIAPW